MADVKISALPASTTPLAGTEILPIVQSSTTRQVSVANLTAGRAVNALSITASSLTSGRVTYAGTAGLLQDNSSFTYGTGLTVNGISQVFQTGLFSTDGTLSNYSVSNGVYLNGNATGWSQLSGDGTRSSFVRVWGSGASPADFIVFNTASSERARIDSSGNLLIGKTSATANGGDLQVSSGITFPATQVAKSDANTLDDYEEGTWTPTDASGASLSLTNTSGNCFYTKVGNLVTLVFRVTFPTTANTSDLVVGGFPFTPKSLTSSSFAGVFSYTNYGTASTILVDGTGRFSIYSYSGTAVTNVLASTKDFRGVITYMV